MAKLNFQHHYASLQSHDDHTEIIICQFDAQETFLLITNVSNWCAA